MNFLRITDLNKSELIRIFEIADDVKKGKYKNALTGKTGVIFFPESSIRTRMTFERAITDMGGRHIMFPPTTLDKSEKHEDVIKYMENWCDFIIVRYGDISTLDDLAKHSSIPVINAMTGHNHPCEIASDIYSIRDLKADFLSLNYTFIGEDGNIGRSWLEAAEVLNINLRHVSKEGYRFETDIKNYCFTTKLDEVLKDSDVVLTDGLPKEFRNEEYYRDYQITFDRMKMAKKDAILNPCPPFTRGMEVSEDVIDSEFFVGYGFKENLLYVQQAIILYCLGIENNMNLGL